MVHNLVFDTILHDSVYDTTLRQSCTQCCGMLNE